MHLSRLAAAAATSAAALAFSLGPAATAWADETTPHTPTASASGDAMDEMDMDSMPAMDHEATPMPGMDHDTTQMPGMEHTHGSTAPSSRPRALVLGGFVLVNGVGMVTALTLRRRGRGERDRKRKARQQAGAPSGGQPAVATDAAVAAASSVLEGSPR